MASTSTETTARHCGLEDVTKSGLARLHPAMSRAYLKVLDTYGEAGAADLLAELEDVRRSAYRIWQQRQFAGSTR